MNTCAQGHVLLQSQISRDSSRLTHRDETTFTVPSTMITLESTKFYGPGLDAPLTDKVECWMTSLVRRFYCFIKIIFKTKQLNNQKVERYNWVSHWKS